jgi:glutamine---fructose-6-phosphate transaminase (isomerizing)
MSIVEQDIRLSAEIAQQTIDRVAERGETFSQRFGGPVAFLGSGSSYCIGVAMASLYEAERHAPAQALLSSEYLPRPGWGHIAISRTGQTSELVDTMRQIQTAGARVDLIVGEHDSPAEEHADAVLPLEFAVEDGIIQTRFITAATLALRLLIGGDASLSALRNLPAEIERGLAELDVAPLLAFRHVVFLGRRWRHGLAQAAALNLEETALMTPEAHQTLDFRHGPIAAADDQTLIWCFDPPDDEQAASVLEEAERIGAGIRRTQGDPLVSLVQAQLLAVRFAEERGLNPDEPRHLSRAVVMPQSGG